MKRTLLLLLTLCSLTALARGAERPKLVVGIVVDQMRWDYLYRYYDHFGSRGFKRLMKDGFRCEQTFINYLPSFTAPGHTCIYTGSVPAIHGIAGNDWYEAGKFIYCTDDKTVLPVGGSKIWGQMSPRNLLTTTIGDELRLATNMRSRVFGLSLKDRSSILPAGHMGKAFWFDDSTGTFSTSTYYDEELPEWVKEFNARHPADTILAHDWHPADLRDTYTQSADDNPRYEGRFSKDEPGTTFPHAAQYFKGSGVLRYNAVRKLPQGNWLTLQLAKRCIAANRLGQSSDPDMLCVSLSSTDYAGHQFGPNAREMEDMYIRLDAQLAAFLEYLDDEVGAGEYTVFLTADHGAAHNSLFLEDLNVPAGNVLEEKMVKDLNKYLQPFTGRLRTVNSLDNYQVYLSDSVKDAAGTLGIIYNWLLARPEVQDAYMLGAQPDLKTAPEPIRTMIMSGYHRGRSGLIQFILKPGYYNGYATTGTTHGTWNPYDTHIPLLWYGWGVPKGQTNREVHMTDIAATLAALLHIQMPNGCVGKVITEIVR
jgi:predicted AlkP superfamily pyrophosphatase or phosphodiesterase